MTAITLSPAILALSRTPAEKILLAYICQRAAVNQEGVCTGSNKEIAAAVGMHLQTVSDLVSRLKDAGLLLVTFMGNRAGHRLLAPPKSIAYANEEVPKSIAYAEPVVPEQPTYSDEQAPKRLTYAVNQSPKSIAYPTESNPDSPHSSYKPTVHSSTPVTRKSTRPLRFCPVTGVDITHQKAYCRIVTITTLRTMGKHDRLQFDALVERFMPDRVNESTSTKCLVLSLMMRRLDEEAQANQ